MAKINIVHALPNSFLPAVGNTIKVKGITKEDVKILASKATEIGCYIRYQCLVDDVNHQLGTNLQPSGENCPPPESGCTVVVASRNPGSTKINYYKIWNGTYEESDYDWRYQMTPYA